MFSQRSFSAEVKAGNRKPAFTAVAWERAEEKREEVNAEVDEGLERGL